MAYREVEMWEILDVLRRFQRGESKAAILHALEIPMTTSEVAARVGVTPGAVSQQLAQLRRAGIVEAHRSGRGVYSYAEGK